jgi:hypothetical protein
MPHTLPVPPKSSETRAIMLLISRDPEHLQVWPDDAFARRGLRSHTFIEKIDGPDDRHLLKLR